MTFCTETCIYNFDRKTRIGCRCLLRAGHRGPHQDRVVGVQWSEKLAPQLICLPEPRDFDPRERN